MTRDKYCLWSRFNCAMNYTNDVYFFSLFIQKIFFQIEKVAVFCKDSKEAFGFVRNCSVNSRLSQYVINTDTDVTLAQKKG